MNENDVPVSRRVVYRSMGLSELGTMMIFSPISETLMRSNLVNDCKSRAI